jgi:hypothetical protein
MNEPTEVSSLSARDLPGRLCSMWDQGQRPDVAGFLAAAAPVELTELVAVLRIDQHRRWQNGDFVRAEEYFNRFPALLADEEKAVELIYCEAILSEQQGAKPGVEEYTRRFPRFAERLRQQFEFHSALGPNTEAFPNSNLGLEAFPPTLPTALTSPAAKALTSWEAPGYDLLRELGRGGMGVVYEAHDRQRGRRVALKTMQGLDAAALVRFKQEFRSLAGLAHANLVTLYELVGEGQRWFYTMELVEGVEFRDYVRGSPTRESRLQRLRAALAQLAAGLHFLHRGGKLHRDVKPSNVLVTPEGRVVLLDFGLATEMDHTRQHRSLRLLGTVAYMAPEQAACLAVGPAADWYAVGVMLYESLTGRLPFDGEMASVLTRKQQEDPRPPGALVSGVPEDLGALCTELLRRAPEERPGGEEILSRLQGASAGHVPAPAPAIEGPLIGRQMHLDRLEAALDQLQGGRPVAVFVSGRSGAGKTALQQRFLEERTRRADAVVLSGRCYEQESVPYKALDGVVDSLSRYLDSLERPQAEALLPRDLAALARVFPVLRRSGSLEGAALRAEATDPQEVRRRGWSALRELLARLGDRHRLIISIDDLQWGDIDSAALLAELLQPPDPPVFLLIACYRAEDAALSPCLRALFAELPAGLARQELAVDPLTAAERHELARALLAPRDAAQEERAAAIAEQSGGYPFFLHELAEHVRTGPFAAGSEGHGLTLSGVLGLRVERLSETARRLLEVVAVAGRPIAQADACAAVDLEGAGEEAVQVLRAGRLIRTAGSGEHHEVETYHDRIREVVVQSLNPDQKREYHQRLAGRLESVGRADAELLAVHLHGAGETQRAAEYYARAAAQAAEALAFERSAALYRRALELRPSGAAGERDLRVHLGDALANAGRGAEAARIYLEAARGADSAARLELLRRAALQFLNCGYVDDGLAVLRTVLSAVRLEIPRTPKRALFGLLWQRLRLRLRGLQSSPRPLAEVPPDDLLRLDACATAGVGLSMVDIVQGAYFQTRSVLLALRAGEPRHLAWALAMEAAHESTGGGHSRQRTARLLALADDAANRAGGAHPHATVLLARGVAAALAGDWREAVQRCGQAEALFRESCTGAGWELGTAYRFALWPLMFMGEVGEIGRRLPALLREAQERDDLYTVTNLTLAVRTFLRLAQDEPEQAREELGQVMDRWSRQGFHVQHMNRVHDEVQIDLYKGDSPAAWERLTRHWCEVRRTHLLRVQQVRVFLLHLRARCALAQAGAGSSTAAMLRSAQRDARTLAKEEVSWALALGVLIDAGICWGRGERTQAAVLFGEAAHRLDAADMRLYAAAARCRQGELLGGPQGKELSAAAESRMAEIGVKNVRRMTALLAPGFPGPPLPPASEERGLG